MVTKEILKIISLPSTVLAFTPLAVICTVVDNPKFHHPLQKIQILCKQLHSKSFCQWFTTLMVIEFDSLSNGWYSKEYIVLERGSVSILS
jgi:hypothetical protein